MITIFFSVVQTYDSVINLATTNTLSGLSFIRITQKSNPAAYQKILLDKYISLCYIIDTDKIRIHASMNFYFLTSIIANQILNIINKAIKLIYGGIYV